MTQSGPAANPARSRPRTRLYALDALRAVAAIAVVLIHTSAWVLLHVPQHTSAFAVAGFFNQASRFAVPAFVLITGAGLFHTYGPGREIDWPAYFLRRLKGLGLPYLFWSVVYVLFYHWAEHDPRPLLLRLLVALASSNAIYTFYFFLIIVPFYLLFPLLRLLTRWIDIVAPAAIVGNGVLIWLSFPHPPKIPALGSHTPFWWMGPFFLGAWLVLRWEGVTAWLHRYWLAFAAFSVGLLLWVMREYQAYVKLGRLADVATNFRPSAYTYGLVILLTIIGAATLLERHGGWVRSLISSFSKYSFTIYLVHPLVMEGTVRLLGALNAGPLIRFALQSLLVLGLSHLLGQVIEKVPGGSWVIGVR